MCLVVIGPGPSLARSGQDPRNTHCLYKTLTMMGITDDSHRSARADLTQLITLSDKLRSVDSLSEGWVHWKGDTALKGPFRMWRRLLSLKYFTVSLFGSAHVSLFWKGYEGIFSTLCKQRNIMPIVHR
jgi:hypothetical protein